MYASAHGSRQRSAQTGRAGARTVGPHDEGVHQVGEAPEATRGERRAVTLHVANDFPLPHQQLAVLPQARSLIPRQPSWPRQGSVRGPPHKSRKACRKPDFISSTAADRRVHASEMRTWRSALYCCTRHRFLRPAGRAAQRLAVRELAVGERASLCQQVPRAAHVRREQHVALRRQQLQQHRPNGVGVPLSVAVSPAASPAHAAGAPLAGRAARRWGRPWWPSSSRGAPCRCSARCSARARVAPERQRTRERAAARRAFICAS
jgi:hypothetical protein